MTPVLLQKALNDLKSDQHRRDVKMVLSNMLSKAMENDLLVKNPAKHLVTRICNEIVFWCKNGVVNGVVKRKIELNL